MKAEKELKKLEEKKKKIEEKLKKDRKKREKLIKKEMEKKKKKEEKENKKIKESPKGSRDLPEKRYSKFSLKYWKEKKLKANDSRCLLINMELNNGFSKTFLVNESEGSFEFDKKTYIIDPSMKYYNVDHKYYVLDYHESWSLPIKRSIDINEMQKALEQSRMYTCETATNPSNLKRFIDSTLIEQVIKGQELTKAFASMKMMLLVGMGSSIVSVIGIVYLISVLAKGG